MDFKVTHQEGIQLSGKLVGSTVSVEYTAMLYEEPAKNGCFLSVWQDTQIPFDKAGDPTSSIIENERTASQVFDQLTTNVPYIIGWGAGNEAGTVKPDYNSIGASILFTPGGDEDKDGIVTGVSAQVCIKPALVSSNSIVVTFDTLDGNNPSKNKNWIGLWQGSTLDFDGGFLEKWDVTSTNDSDSQGLNVKKPIRAGSTYTLAYASGPNVSDIVARVTFKTASY
jgi:hypothetical protein